MTKHSDTDYMRAALRLARSGLGRTWPNPSVGCVIVKDGAVIAQACTAHGGRPHAERLAVEQAGSEAKGATAYVTLEPCAHHGKTPPCSGFLIEAGIKRVVIACSDPDKRVNGEGIRQLKAAGVQVEVGILEKEARALNRGFFLRETKQRPLVTLKAGLSADGNIAAAPGQKTVINGEAAWRRIQLERSYHDAVLVGINTVLADDPMLNARVPGVEHPTVRVVLDRNLQIPLSSQLVKTARQFPLWVFHDNDPGDKAIDFEKAGVRLFKDTAVTLVVKALAAEGVTRLLVEGGTRVHEAFLEAGLCDRLFLMKSPHVLGGAGVRMADWSKSGLKVTKTARFSEDLLEIYEGQD